METAASFEARSAPSLYPTAAKWREIRMPTLFIHGEGNTGGCDIASTHWTCEV